MSKHTFGDLELDIQHVYPRPLQEAESGHKQVCEEARVLDEEMDRP